MLDDKFQDRFQSGSVFFLQTENISRLSSGRMDFLKKIRPFSSLPKAPCIVSNCAGNFVRDVLGCFAIYDKNNF